jgi:hypothetical protein
MFVHSGLRDVDMPYHVGTGLHSITTRILTLIASDVLLFGQKTDRIFELESLC